MLLQKTFSVTVPLYISVMAELRGARGAAAIPKFLEINTMMPPAPLAMAPTPQILMPFTDPESGPFSLSIHLVVVLL